MEKQAGSPQTVGVQERGLGRHHRGSGRGAGLGRKEAGTITGELSAGRHLRARGPVKPQVQDQKGGSFSQESRLEAGHSLKTSGQRRDG